MTNFNLKSAKQLLQELPRMSNPQIEKLYEYAVNKECFLLQKGKNMRARLWRNLYQAAQEQLNLDTKTVKEIDAIAEKQARRAQMVKRKVNGATMLVWPTKNYTPSIPKANKCPEEMALQYKQWYKQTHGKEYHA